MNRTTPAKTFLILACLGLALPLSAQSTTTMAAPVASPSPARNSGYGLLGEEYSGLRLGYTAVDDGPPNVVHTYGFVANRPTSPNLDASFRYDYSRSNAFGLRNRQHAFEAGGTAYLPFADVKPFVEGHLGWAFQKGDAGRRDSFTYRVAAGVEFQAATQLALAPYVSYQEASHFNSHAWNYGATATYRVAREWSLTVAAQIDDKESIEYRFGINRHF